LKASTFWQTVVSDRSDFLDRLVALLTEHGLRYCLIGGQGVNAYTDPVVSLDLDIAIELNQIPLAKSVLARHFKVEEFPHSLILSDPGSDLRLQVQTDPRYSDFVSRAKQRDVLGWMLEVADVADVLQGKVWAAGDPTRRASKRLKDYADIARILESYPELVDRVPQEIRERLS
jgi:hypothetical protein